MCYTNVNSSFCFFVTSHTKHILSNGNSLRRAVLCIIAVSNDCGLKKPANHTTFGSLFKIERKMSKICIGVSLNESKIGCNVYHKIG